MIIMWCMHNIGAWGACVAIYECNVFVEVRMYRYGIRMKCVNDVKNGSPVRNPHLRGMIPEMLDLIFSK
eukprot:1355983-Amorphochlora_amoeboformis.AAC.1